MATLSNPSNLANLAARFLWQSPLRERFASSGGKSSKIEKEMNREKKCLVLLNALQLKWSIKAVLPTKLSSYTVRDYRLTLKFVFY